MIKTDTKIFLQDEKTLCTQHRHTAKQYLPPKQTRDFPLLFGSGFELSTVKSKIKHSKYDENLTY